MIRISKMTDYALVILAFLTKAPEEFMHATQISQNTKVNKPTTAKVLKALARHGLLASYRGASGGYKLNRRPEHITVAQIIEILEGPVAIMDCAKGKEFCALSGDCEINAPWNKINSVIFKALDTIKLSDLYSRPVRAGDVYDLKV